METRETTFVLRFSLTTTIPDSLLEQDDFEEDSWLEEWERSLKPVLVRSIFQQLRSFPSWRAHVRNRGISPLDEIEIVLEKDLVTPEPAR
ncbi:MAG TPA: hypothetical protein VMT89_00715 [Candidatus Acidoferrales bacterium]|nr:hypothetical protein [Candidatus Acidoferrales bacterium]